MVKFPDKPGISRNLKIAQLGLIVSLVPNRTLFCVPRPSLALVLPMWSLTPVDMAK